MVQIDIPAAFIASQFFLDLGRSVVRKEAVASKDRLPAVYYRFLARALFFAGAVIAPSGIYLLAGWPGWEQLYWTARVENVIFNWANALLPAFFVMSIVLAAYCGHRIGYQWIVTGREKYLRPTYVGLLLLVSVVVLLNYPAFLLVGTYQEYHQSPEVMAKAWDNPYDFSSGWFGVMIYFSACLLYLWRVIAREAKGA